MSLIALTACLITNQLQEELPPLGTNLAAFSAGSTQWPLVDAFKMSSPWKATSGQLDIDEHGNVKALKSGQVAETVIYTNGRYPTGKYTLTWKGEATFTDGDGITLPDVTTGKATVDVTGDTGIRLNLTKVDPANPPHDIRLIMPGYEEVAEDEPFHPVFLQRMSLYRSLRFADWGAVSGSAQKSWSERATPDNATFANGQGVPYETMIDLANRKSAMPWICVPHLADDDYVRNLAKLVKANLQSGLKVAIEFSDEGWNETLPQGKWCQEQGKAKKLSDNDHDNGLRFYAQRSTEVFAIFEDVFGEKTRLVRVLSTPFGQPKDAETIITWNNANRKSDALAVDLTVRNQSPATTLDDLFTKLNADVAGPTRDRLFEFTSLAEKYRLKLTAYRGGSNLTSSDPATDKLCHDASNDSKLGDLFTALFKNWRAAGGTLFMSQTDCSPWTTANRASTLEYQNQDPQKSFKNRALIQYALFPDR